MPRRRRVAAVLLAAGGSVRLGRPKQLLPFRHHTLLRHATETALASTCETVYVVLGALSERMVPELEDLPVHVVRNADWQEGMGASIRCGVSAALRGTDRLDGVLLLLADQPLVTPAHLVHLVSLFRDGHAPIVAAYYADRPGVPVLFGATLFADLMALKGDQGARRLVDARLNDTLLVDLPEAASDVDLEADFEALQVLEVSDHAGERRQGR